MDLGPFKQDWHPFLYLDSFPQTQSSDHHMSMPAAANLSSKPKPKTTASKVDVLPSAVACGNHRAREVFPPTPVPPPFAARFKAANRLRYSRVFGLSRIRHHWILYPGGFDHVSTLLGQPALLNSLWTAH